MDKYLFNWLSLRCSGAFTAAQQRALLARYKTVGDINWREVNANRVCYGLSPTAVLPLQRTACTFVKKYRETVARYKGAGIDYLSPKDKRYPLGLKMPEPLSELLHVKGDVTLLNCAKKVAIVGSRKPTSYGRRVAAGLSTFLASRGVCVVSGMAIGVDAIAHNAAIQAGGRTIAVLASGIEAPYPKTNRYLFDKILQTGGCVFSERGDDAPPMKHHFPLRNRLISAVSDLVVVIEAAEKSGSLTTAQHGIDQGRSIFALPGSIFSEQSRGSNQLIADGAYPLINYEDILVCLGIDSKEERTAECLPAAFEALSNGAKRIYMRLLRESPASVAAIEIEEGIENSDVVAAFTELVCEELCHFISLNEIEIL
ncbi:DNA-processing protein DprA [Fusibacter sp. JL298sf-3]